MEAMVVFVDGGMTFHNREDYLDYLRNRDVSLGSEENWSKGEYLTEKLDSEFAEVDMPCKDNASYEEWKINFENYLSEFPEKLVLVGYSLGGTFLAKYLSENNISNHLLSVYLVAPPFDGEMPSEDLAGGFNLGSNVSALESRTDKVELMFSEDDHIVPSEHAEKFRQNLQKAEINIFQDKNGHFRVEKFPELVEKINQDLKKAKMKNQVK